MKKFFTIICTFILTFNILAVGVSAEQITPTPEVYDGTWVINTTDFLETCWNSAVREIAKSWVVGSDIVFGEFEHFITWLEGDPNYGVLEQYPNTVVHSTHPPTGIEQLDLNNSTQIDVPIPVQNTILEFIQYNIAQNPLSYKECYIYSYNFLDPSRFPNYNMYKAVQDYMRDNEGYHIIQYVGTYGSSVTECRIATISHDNNLGFVGTSLNGGFTQVRIYKNWLNNFSVENCPLFNSSGTISNKSTQNVSFNLYNVSTLNAGTIFTSYPKNELVYVFGTLNAYKNYNSGIPQDYYLTSEGIETGTWTVNGSGAINTGQMDNSSYYYNNVVSNIQSGWTADEVLALVDKISQGGGSNGNGSGTNGDSSDGWLDLGIFGDIGRAIAKILGGIIEAIATVFTEIISIVTQVSETLLQGTIFEFLSAFMGWLPEEIIAVLTALFSVAVLFALIKLIREAF